MKRSLTTLGLMGVLAIIATPANASNSMVEKTLRSYGDLTMFYQAMVNTGVINELREDQNYTVFAPNNAAFASLSTQTYPCFYAVQCRPQIAALIRSHIIVGRYDLPLLTTYGQGVKTASGRLVHVVEEYKGTYEVDGTRILSSSDVGGNYFYRINELLAEPQELAVFQTVNYAPAGSTVTTEKTVTRKTFVSPNHPAYPAGAMMPPVYDDGSTTRSTTVIKTYTNQP